MRVASGKMSRSTGWSRRVMSRKPMSGRAAYASDVDVALASSVVPVFLCGNLDVLLRVS